MKSKKRTLLARSGKKKEIGNETRGRSGREPEVELLKKKIGIKEEGGWGQTGAITNVGGVRLGCLLGGLT